MKLKSFGCSFIYGSDLADEKNYPGNQASAFSWPALLAKQINLKYECYARPGSGNLSILERIIEQSIDATKNDIFIIGWSWIDRFDYYDKNCNEKAKFTDTTTNDYYLRWKTILPIQQSKESTFYYKNIHSQYQDKLTTLIYIRSAIDLLQKKNIPFIMTHMDNLIFETEWHSNDTIEDLQNYIRPWITTFDDNTFLDWSKKNNFAISQTLHPLEHAHIAGFKYIFNKIQNYKIA